MAVSRSAPAAGSRFALLPSDNATGNVTNVVQRNTALIPRLSALVITASIGALREIIDTSITNVALIPIQASLGATLVEVGWVVPATPLPAL